MTVSDGTARTIGNFGGTKVPLPLSTGLTVGDALVVKRRFASSEYFRQLLLCLGERALSPFRNLLMIWTVVLTRLTGCQIQAPISPAPLFRPILPDSYTLSPSPLHPRIGSVDGRVSSGCVA